MMEKFKRLTEAAYYLDFKKFIEICIMMIAIRFYIGSTESEYEEFKKKHNLKECTEEEEQQIISEFHFVFEHINEVFFA